MRLWSIAKNESSKATSFLLSSLSASPSPIISAFPVSDRALSFVGRGGDGMKLTAAAEPFPLNIVTSPGAELLASRGTRHQVYPFSRLWNQGKSAERLRGVGPHRTPDHLWVSAQSLLHLNTSSISGSHGNALSIVSVWGTYARTSPHDTFVLRQGRNTIARMPSPLLSISHCQSSNSPELKPNTPGQKSIKCNADSQQGWWTPVLHMFTVLFI